MSFRTNRRTLKPFPVHRNRTKSITSLLSFKGQPLTEAESWLREHGFAYFDQTFNDPYYAPRGLTRVQYMDNFGDLMILIFDNDSIIVGEKFLPAPDTKAYEESRRQRYGQGVAIDEYEAKK